MDPINIYPYGLIVLCLLLYLSRNKYKNYFLIKKRLKGKKNMNEKILKDFIGKEVTILLYGDSFNIVGKIVSIENGWIKFETKKEVKLLNSELIVSIALKK